jgi:hypothetical protein
MARKPLKRGSVKAKAMAPRSKPKSAKAKATKEK